jgi:serine protease Do
MSRYFSDIAQEVGGSIVRLPRLEGSGVVWDTYGGILAAAPGGWLPPVMDLVAVTGDRVAVVTRIGGPHLPVVFLQAPVNTTFPKTNYRSADTLRVGEWVLAVARQANGSILFTPGWYTGREISRCGEISFQRVASNLSLEAAVLGGGLFDMDGNLVAVIVQCDGSYVAMSIDDITTALGAENSLTSQLLYRYGMKVEPLSPELLAYFDVERGIWVREVWKGYPADAVGLAAGDLIVGLDGAAVEILQDLEPLTRPGPDFIFALEVKRGQRTEAISLPGNGNKPRSTNSDSTIAGIFVGDPEAGYEITSVDPEGAAAQAGLRPGDRLLQIEDTPVTGAAVLRRLLANPNRGTTLAVADRGAKTVALVLK